jgi:hypothetical protein
LSLDVIEFLAVCTEGSYHSDVYQGVAAVVIASKMAKEESDYAPVKKAVKKIKEIRPE